MIILIPRMEIQCANAMVGQHFIATTPIMAASLMGHALGRELGHFPSGTAWLHHTAQLLGAGDDAYGRFQPQQRRGAVFIDDSDYSSKNRHALSLQPTVSAHLTASVMFRFESAVNTDDVYRFLRHARVAGGAVREHGPVQVMGLDTPDEQIIKALPGGGFWLIERSDLVDPSQPLDSLMTALAHRPQTTKPKADPAVPGADPADITQDSDEDEFSLVADWEDDESVPATDPPSQESTGKERMSWLSPALLGYALTTTAARRIGVRGDYEHAFAEPLIGLTQFVSRRQHPVRVPWWQHGWSADDVFLVTQDPSLLDASLNPAPSFNPGKI